MRWPLTPVKKRLEAGSEPRSPGRFLEGWTLAIPSVGIALVAALLGVPRPIEPRAVPRPVITTAEISESLHRLHGQAQFARESVLPHAVRAVGEKLRQLGRLVHDQSREVTNQQRSALRRQVTQARRLHGDKALLALRAVQAELFVEALHDWEREGRKSPDLVELGADFLEQAQKRGWVVAHRLLADETERTALFLIRWDDLTGLSQDGEFRLSPALERVRLRFLLDHTPLTNSQAGLLLSWVERLGQLDRDYPRMLARGIVATRAGDLSLARASFEDELLRSAGGPWSLRARNHLLFVLENQGAGSELDPLRQDTAP